MTRTGIFSALARYVAWSRLRRRQVRTIRLLASLPPEIQADIGWPDLHVSEAGVLHSASPAGRQGGSVARLQPRSAGHRPVTPPSRRAA